MKNILLITALLLVPACSSLAPQARRFLDSTTHTDAAPNWVTDTKTSWEERDKMFIHLSQSVKGTERVNGCFDLVRLDSKEHILSEIANDVKGTLDNAQQSISEDAELVLGKVRSSEFSGRITGLRFTEQYFERYLIGETERIDCHILSEMKLSDYNRIKREIVDRIVAVDPKLKEAITKKQVEFFNKGQERVQ